MIGMDVAVTHQASEEKKGRYLTQSYDKNLYSNRKNPNNNVTTQKRHQNYTTNRTD